MRFTQFILAFLGLVCLALLLANASCVWDWADDYAIKLPLRTQTVWQWSVSQYLILMLAPSIFDIYQKLLGSSACFSAEMNLYLRPKPIEIKVIQCWPFSAIGSN